MGHSGGKQREGAQRGGAEEEETEEEEAARGVPAVAAGSFAPSRAEQRELG